LSKSRFPEMLEAAASLVVVEGDANLMKQAYVRARMTNEWSFSKVVLLLKSKIKNNSDVQCDVFRIFES